MLEDLVLIIQSNSVIMSLLGDNLFVNRIPFESTLPALMLQSIDNTPTTNKDTDRVLDRYLVLINVYSEDYKTIQTITDEIRILGNCYSLTNSTSIKQLIYDSESDIYEENRNIMLKTISYLVLY